MASIRSRDEVVFEAAALSLVGGFLDAYTYLAHGGVFANAQTGNVVLFGVAAAQGHWARAWPRVVPVVAFLLGSTVVEVLARTRDVRVLARPARVVLVVEAAVLLVVGLARTPDAVATVLITLVSTMQVGTFRQARGTTYATTFTTGNLRSLIAQGAGWLIDGDVEAGGRARVLAAVVAAFATGGLAGGVLTDALGSPAVLLVVPVLAAVLVSLVVGTRKARFAAAPGLDR